MDCEESRRLIHKLLKRLSRQNNDACILDNEQQASYNNPNQGVFMLGEDHSLLHDFPEYKDKIVKLMESDHEFATKAKRYHELDKDIRKLELKDAPIDDETFHQCKHERALLKDVLYRKLTTA